MTPLGKKVGQKSEEHNPERILENMSILLKAQRSSYRHTVTGISWEQGTKEGQFLLIF